MSTKSELIDFTIGTDPEFNCVNGRKQIVASEDFFENEDACDSELGADGNGITFELRPKPNKNPLEVVHNIRDILMRTSMERPDFLKLKWISQSFHRGYPMGGHVHFGLTDVSYSDSVNILDNYVGSISLLLENKSQGLMRRSEGYGGMGDYREQDWGFEYRPMSSWLSTPYIASAILCLCKTVMYEVVNNPSFEFKKWFVTDDFHYMNQNKILENFPKIWVDIRKMKLYNKYKTYLDLIHFLVTNKRTWHSNFNMSEEWGIVNFRPQCSQAININSLWANYKLETTV